MAEYGAPLVPGGPIRDAGLDFILDDSVSSQPLQAHFEGEQNPYLVPTSTLLPGFFQGNRWRPEEVDRFQEYRRNYHQFRRGAAFGAVGETSEIKGEAPGAGLGGEPLGGDASAVRRVPQVKKRKRRSQEEIKSSHRQVERRRTRRINDLIESLKSQIRAAGRTCKKDKVSVLASAVRLIEDLHATHGAWPPRPEGEEAPPGSLGQLSGGGGSGGVRAAAFARAPAVAAAAAAAVASAPAVRSGLAVAQPLALAALSTLGSPKAYTPSTGDSPLITADGAPADPPFFDVLHLLAHPPQASSPAASMHVG